MDSQNLQVSVRRNWFSGSRVYLLTAEFQSAEILIPVADVLAEILEAGSNAFPEISFLSLEQPIRSGELLENVRGRALESVNISDHPAPEEELFASVGNIQVEEALDGQDVLSQEQEFHEASRSGVEPFVYRIMTRFHSYPDSKTVLHELSTKVSGSLQTLQSVIFPKALSRIQEISMNGFRIGYEVYGRRFASASLGFPPRVVKQVFLEVEPGRFFLRLETETPRSSRFQPKDDPTLSAIGQVFGNLGIFPGLCEEVERQLQTA